MHTVVREYNGHQYEITTDDEFKYIHASIHREEEIQLAGGEIRKIYPAMARYKFGKNVSIVGIDELLRAVIDYKIRVGLYLSQEDFYLLIRNR